MAEPSNPWTVEESYDVWCKIEGFIFSFFFRWIKQLWCFFCFCFCFLLVSVVVVVLFVCFVCLLVLIFFKLILKLEKHIHAEVISEFKQCLGGWALKLHVPTPCALNFTQAFYAIAPTPKPCFDFKMSIAWKESIVEVGLSVLTWLHCRRASWLATELMPRPWGLLKYDLSRDVLLSLEK